MKAVWYEQFGAAPNVLTTGTMADPKVESGSVLVQLKASGINPSDVKLRAGARPGALMEWPRVIPHSDGAGVIDAVGQGVDHSRVGQRVWIWNGQWKRPFGTAAELISVPDEQAVRLPDDTSFDEGACLGIPAMTAWYSLFSDGPIEDQTVLVTGGAGTVGRYACQMARLAGARVITTVSSAEKGAHSTAETWINYQETDVVEAVMDLTDGQGVDRIIEVDFGANQSDALALLKPGGTIASYASASNMTPQLSFYPFMFKNITLRMLIVYLLDPKTRRRGEEQLTTWLEAGQLSHAVVRGGGLDDAVTAHETVETAAKLGTVVLSI